MHYEEPLYRPPSEAHSFILQATIGCSWNHCTYCDMYRSKTFRIKPTTQLLKEIREAALGDRVKKVFVADGDALTMPTSQWLEILAALKHAFPELRQVSCYAMASNILEKSSQELQELREAGLKLLYIGPESGDDLTLKRIAKGGTFAEHVDSANMSHQAGIKLSTIFLLGAAGTQLSSQHAMGSAKLITEMNPQFLSALTLTVVPNTPIARMESKGNFELPSVEQLLGELRTMVHESHPKASIFRTNHASNYLPLEGRLPRDKERITNTIDAALAGKINLRSEEFRGL